jgi:PAS domain S-box-containing protein
MVQLIMTGKIKLGRNIFHLLLTLLGLVLTILGSIFYLPPNIQWGVLILNSLFIAFLFNFHLDLQNHKITLIQVVALGGALLYGPLPSAWSVIGGVLLGYFIHQIQWIERGHQYHWLNDIGALIGMNILPLMVFIPFGMVNGLAQGTIDRSTVWLDTTGPVLIFSMVHGVLFLLNLTLISQKTDGRINRDLVSLLIIEFMPLPLILLAVEAYPAVGNKVMIAIGAIPMILAILMHGMGIAREAQDRRVQELSILDRVSQTLRSTLELNELLPVIQEQVTQILGLDNFYVALYDRTTEEIWYPLAVKHGRRQHWDRRPITNRLTDRVIRESRPISLTPQSQAGPNPVGLPPSEDTPASWLGVPLIVSDRSIGCLAVSELTTGVEFTSADIDLLTILSGQVSVAIDNALLYEQSQRRATQLETLNQLTGTITASLNPQEVLAHVCGSVSLVGGGHRNAIFLLDPGEDQVTLAYKHGLSSGFAERNATFSIADNTRTRCLRTGQPYIVSDISHTSLSRDLVLLFRADDILAFADFPLVTPDGQIGFLSVFFDTPHEFSREETELLQTFASQAALAVANARLHATTDEQLARRVNQLAILEAVGRKLSGAIHSNELFQLILDYSLDFTNALCGAVVIFHADTQQIELKANSGYLATDKFISSQETITGRAIATQKTINIGDIASDSSFLDLSCGTTLSQLSVPIIHESRALGAITLESPNLDAFDKSEQSFTEQLANQAAIALVNAELYSETQNRLQEQSMLYQVSTRMVGVLDLDEVVQVIERALNVVFEPTILGTYLWDPDQQLFGLRGNAERPPNGNPASETITFEVINALTRDDSEIALIYLAEQDPGVDLFMGESQNSQIVVLPLIVAQEWFGFIVMGISAERQILENEFDLMRTIVAQGSLVLQNARLFSDATNGRERLAAIINSVGEGIIMVNTLGQILLLNEPIRVFTGVPIDQLVQTFLTELPQSVLQVIGFSREEISTIQTELTNGEIPVSQKLEYQLPNSSTTRVIERETSPVLSQNGKAIGWMIVLRDTTEEYEINQAREMITETIVHDLRSPMSAVVGAMDLIESTLTDDDRDELIHQSIRVAKSGANRVLGLIEALMDIARLSSGHLELAYIPMNVREIVTELMDDFTLLANEYGIIMRAEIPADLPVIMADQEKIIRVLTNLMDNAVKFTPQGGQIVISADRVDNNCVKIAVADSGPGIPEEYREKIFERFAQIPGRRSRRRGSGLGLAFCQLAVEAHGGQIWVESPTENGSVFNFMLPIESITS